MSKRGMVVFKIKTVYINIPVALTVVLGILLLKEIALFLEEEKKRFLF